MLRTHTCGELRAAQAGRPVTLCGWVDLIRDFGGTLFLVLRDRYGKVQVTIDPDCPDAVRERARELRFEYVVRIVGHVRPRPAGQTNPKMPTGEIEVHVAELEILNASDVPPFTPSQVELPGEDLRLQHRYIDLRRDVMQRTLLLRHRIVKTMRDFFDEHDFVEIETPILGRSTPEGARDYLVPSRVHPGTFYALPQSPQLYKQLMMIAGYDRYVQVAKCFRDEDLRADRQPEFTQLDLEMSFVDADDVIGMIDGLMQRLARDILGIELTLPLPRMTYDEAMRRFGHDAPDLRFGLELVDCTDLAAQADFQVFRNVAAAGNHVRGINVRGASEQFTRKKIDQLTTYVQEDYGAKGLAWFKVDGDGKLTGSIAKNFSDGQLAQWAERMQAAPGDVLLFVADTWDVTCRALHGLRKTLGAELKLYDPSQKHFSWVIEFPMFDFDAENQRWVAMHHPFTAPRDQDLGTLSTDPRAARAKAYDLVVNGFECGGGTIRIHQNAVQQTVFGLLGLSPEEAKARFGFLLDALRFGAPPHGGIALGVDRIVMLFGGLDNIRDCMAFPKNQRAMDLMTAAPNVVDEAQLHELGIRLR